MSLRDRSPTLVDFKPVVDEMIQCEQAGIIRAIKRLISDNAEMGGSPEGYRFRARLYSVRKPFELRGLRITDINDRLKSRAEIIERRIDRVRGDGTALRQGLAVIASRCRTYQQLRDALPDCLVRKFSNLSGLARMDDEGWVLRDDPNLFKQFQNTVEIALRFEANRLIQA